MVVPVVFLSARLAPGLKSEGKESGEARGGGDGGCGDAGGGDGGAGEGGRGGQGAARLEAGVEGRPWIRRTRKEACAGR